MDITTLFLLFIALLLLILLLAFSQSTILVVNRLPFFKNNLKHRYKLETLRHTVYQYRLAKMLHYIGVRVEDFVKRTPEWQVKKHVVRCRSCTNINICDQCLRDGKYVSDMHFCPNYSSLMSLSKIMPPVEKE